jgi:8-oxo-dGTP diphosphatase
MGAGRANLLKRIRDSGSLSKAAKEMGMSYRLAWGIVHHMEDVCGEKIVQSVRGGSARGKTVLTDFGNELLAEFERSERSIEKASGTRYLKPSLTTDGILLVDSKLLLVKRKKDPFKGKYALPGGFVEYGEKVEDAVIREFREETGLEVAIGQLLGVYSAPGRDPRGHTVSVVFVLSHRGGMLADSDETHAEWFPIAKLPQMAFDHNQIVSDYRKTVRKSR